MTKAFARFAANLFVSARCAMRSGTSVEVWSWRDKGPRPASRNFIHALHVEWSFTKNVVNAVTFAIPFYRSVNIAETKRQIGHHKEI